MADQNKIAKNEKAPAGQAVVKVVAHGFEIYLKTRRAKQINIEASKLFEIFIDFMIKMDRLNLWKITKTELTHQTHVS